jgi:hypothetical protein
VIKSEFSYVHVNTLTEYRDATFFEEIFPMKDRVATPSEASTSSVPQPIPFSLPPIHSEQPIEDYNIDAPRRIKRQRTEKSFGDDFTVYLVDDHQNHFQRHMHHQMQSTGRRQSTMKWIPF